MPEESKESKAKKLAAARKKLKEYQQRGFTAGNSSTTVPLAHTESSSNSGQVSSNISERSESELQLNGSVNDLANADTNALELPAAGSVVKEQFLQTENVNYFTMEQTMKKDNTSYSVTNSEEDDRQMEGLRNINAIQVLITEKAQLTTELNKFRTLCREKDLEMEELRVQHNNASKRVEDLSQRLVDMQKQQEQQRLHNAELQHKLAQARAQEDEYSSHINELKQQLSLSDERLKRLEIDFKEKNNELELAQLRIRQLSDENNITKDNRVETLTQTQFMYEQQIRDLQAMVQQLTQDKEQANTQYQTYVQQLNAQVQQLTERNNDLTEETVKLQEREKQCVDHIQQLEREIQKNLSKQQEVKEEHPKDNSTSNQSEQLQALQERLNDFEAERYEFQLKIKFQEDRLNSLQYELQQREAELVQLRDHLENVTSEQPDKVKLLATMESDKVAASRALSQNVELKKQLDELELRFVQLTNDKADLMNRLDAEQYANREVHANYASMEEHLRTIDERFKFKDEEMIRLSHENEELKKQLENKQGQFSKNENEILEYYGDDHEHHDHCHNEHDHEQHHDSQNHLHHHDEQQNKECSHNHHQHHHNGQGEHQHEEYQHKSFDNQQNRNEIEHSTSDCNNDHEPCQDVTEGLSATTNKFPTPLTSHNKNFQTKASNTTTPHIATEEAVEKLQQRFTQLMTQCADLTEEKQRLEHLVMQLQSETETIGEYIALYQTQRRMLKQREYEKAAQTAMLQAEREQMRERLNILNNLVNSLGMELPENQEKLKQQINEALAQNVAIDVTQQHQEAVVNEMPEARCLTDDRISLTKDLNSPESQQILHKIQDIITEIKENTKELPTVTHTVDQLKCCSGKFEVV